MKIMYMVLGPFMTNTYIVYNEQTLEGLVVDPSFSPEQYIHAIQEKKIHLKSILLTHGHVDHMAGMNELRKAFPEAEMYMDRRDREFLRDPAKNLSYMFPTPVLVDDADHWVKNGDSIDTCGFTFKVIDTAGHTPGGISFYDEKDGLVFTGIPCSRVHRPYGLSRRQPEGTGGEYPKEPLCSSGLHGGPFGPWKPDHHW